MKSWFHDDDIEMYPTRNEDKSVVAERQNLHIYDFNIKKCMY